MLATNPRLLFAAALLTATLMVVLAGCHSAPPDDTALNSAVQRKLAADTAINAEPVQSFAQSGVVTLQGSVSSEAARALAASDALQVAGVRSVVNQLTVQATIPRAQTATVRPTPVPPRTPLARSDKPSAMLSHPNPQPLPTQTSRSDNPPLPAPIERRSPPQDQTTQFNEQTSRQPLTPRQVPPPTPSFRSITVPAGTTLAVRITQTLDSATAQQGDTFSGSLSSDLMVDGLVAIPAGTTVGGRLDQVHEAGHFKGSALLTISLVSLSRRGERTPIATDPYTQEGTGRGKNTAEKAGGGAAVGAILGGIFGGGKGAAVGAAAGGGLGAGSNGITRGQQVQIPSETLIRFRLANPIEVHVSTPIPNEGDTNLQRHPGN